ASAMRRGICQRIDDLELFDDRAWPSVRHDYRQRIGMLRTHVDEVDVDTIDLRDELREGIELRLALPPVVLGLPVACELLDGGELYALRLILDGFPRRPAGCHDTAFQIGEGLVGNMNLERADSFGPALGGCVCGCC